MSYGAKFDEFSISINYSLLSTEFIKNINIFSFSGIRADDNGDSTRNLIYNFQIEKKTKPSSLFRFYFTSELAIRSISLCFKQLLGNAFNYSVGQNTNKMKCTPV